MGAAHSFGTVTLQIQQYGLYGRTRTHAVMRLEEWLTRSNHSLVQGSLRFAQNRYRGRFVLGWSAWAMVVVDGKPYLGDHYVSREPWPISVHLYMEAETT